ncbi:MAG: hypothetical protein QW404_00880 [Candidatus Nanoarchaeia archaeon]
MKKGVMITLGMFFLASVVFSLGILMFHNTKSLNDRFGELALFDRLYELDSSIGMGLRRIFDYRSGLAVDVYNESVVFTETLPRSSNFGNVMDQFKSYVEDNYNVSPKVVFDSSVYSSVKNKLTLNVEPKGIVYTHDAFGDEEIMVSPQSVDDVKSYVITITSTAQSATITWNYVSSGSMPFTIKVEHSSGSLSSTVNVNPAAYSSAYVLLSYPSTWRIDIDINNPAMMNLSTKDNHDVIFSTNITMNIPQDERIIVTYPQNLYNITFPESNLTKFSTARIA